MAKQIKYDPILDLVREDDFPEKNIVVASGDTDCFDMIVAGDCDFECGIQLITARGCDCP